MTRRPPVFGPEPWQGSWTHWDLWMCLVAVLDHDGDLASLEESFIAEMGDLTRRNVGEAKWSHLTDLKLRLADAGVEPFDLVAPEHLTDRTLVAKARRKVAGRGIEHRAKTPAMIETPRVRLERRAKYAAWPSFPSPPDPWYERLRPAVEVKDFVTVGRTVKKVSTLQERLERLDRPSLSVAERLALYRAMHSALIELIERSDDSYGEIGRFREDVWGTYLAIDWRQSGMDPAAYYQDLCELLVWEQYGLRREILPFEKVGYDEVDLVEGILLDLERQHREVYLRWQADEAACQIAWLLLATGRSDRFAGAAHRIGTEHWMPIVALAEAALDSDGPEAAFAVFRAADRPGMQREYLAQQCLKLTGRPLRHLRVVDEEGGT